MHSPQRTEEKLARWRVQSEEWNVQNAALVDLSSFVHLVTRLGHEIDIDGLLEVVAYFDDTAQDYGSESVVVGNIGDNAHFLDALRSLLGRNVPTTGTTDWNSVVDHQFGYFDIQHSFSVVLLFLEHSVCDT